MQFCRCSSTARRLAHTIAALDTTMTECRPLKIGLTGSIGMGKSTISRQLQTLGFPLFDADAVVHQMYARGGAAVSPISSMFPGAIVDGAVDRLLLGNIVLSSPAELKRLEDIIHPLVAQEREIFFTNAEKANAFAVVFDIPLLFEKHMESDVDVVIVVTASPETQRNRVLSRPGVSVERFEAIIAKQLPDELKREKADFVINTDFQGFAAGRAQLTKIIETLIERDQHRYALWKRNFGNNLSSVANAGPINAAIDVVVFDLDETLAPVDCAVGAGNAAMVDFMKEHMVETARTPLHEIRAHMKRIIDENPLISHDFGEMRKAALTHIASAHGEDHRVDEAVQIFSDLRSDLDCHLYADVLPCLDWIRSLNIKTGVFTNSNAVVSKDSILGSKLDIYMHAGEIGGSKPSPVPFLALSQRLQVNPGRVLYVGDSYHHDVVGAHLAGMKSAYLRREADICDRTFESMFARYGIQPDITLNSLHPEEFEEKLASLALLP